MHGSEGDQGRPPSSRQTRRRKGKSDPTDAEAAARAVLSAEAAGSPKAGDDLVEMIRVLRVARGTAIKARTQAINALRSLLVTAPPLLVTAPPKLRDELRALSTSRLVGKAAQLRPGERVSPLAASKLALRHLARRCQLLEAEINSVDAQLAQLTAAASPHLTSTFGIGADTAGALLVAAGDNPDRLRSEAAFSMLCGSSPIPASSGQTRRHRLNRGGNRQANAALYRIVLVRMRYHQPKANRINGPRTAIERRIPRCSRGQELRSWPLHAGTQRVSSLAVCRSPGIRTTRQASPQASRPRMTQPPGSISKRRRPWKAEDGNA